MQGPPRPSDIVDIWGHRGETGADDKLKEVTASKQQVDWNHSLTLNEKKKKKWNMRIWLIMVVNFISFSFLVIEYIFLQAEGTEQVHKEKLNMKEK